jgi:hypothetical protein
MWRLWEADEDVDETIWKPIGWFGERIGAAPHVRVSGTAGRLASARIEL